MRNSPPTIDNNAVAPTRVLGVIAQSRMLKSDLESIAAVKHLTLQPLEHLADEAIAGMALPVIMTDLTDFNSRGLRLIERLRSNLVPTVFVFHAVSPSSKAVRHAFLQDAIDVLFRPTADVLQSTISRAFDCYSHRVQTLERVASSKSILKALSGRQTEILPRLIRGETGREIASAIGIAETTVAKHRQVIYERTGTTGILQLMRFYADARSSMDSIFSFRPPLNPPDRVAE